jgi:hypothetical protein
MDGPTTQLETIATAQSQKEVTANGLFDSMSPAALFGRRAASTSGLTWAMYGGKFRASGTPGNLSNCSVGLNANTTNYVEFDPANTGSNSGVSVNQTGFTAGRVRLYTVVTNASNVVTSWTDHRDWGAPTQPRISFSVAGAANVTLTDVQAAAGIVELTGAITASIAVIFPTQPRLYALFNNTTGAFTLTARTSGGTGVQLPRGSRVMVYTDGTDVQPIEPQAFLQQLAYAATITPDASKAERFLIGALTGALTIAAPSNAQPGSALEFTFLQDGTGGRVITWNAVFKKAADGAGTANQRGSTRFLFDGTNWIQQGGAMTWYT